MSKRALVIVNLHSGIKQGAKVLPRLIDELCKDNWSVTVYSTQRVNDGFERTKRNCKKYDRIFCIGGDGTLNEVISGMTEAECDVPIAYIPTGSTNDFAATLNIPKDINEAVKRAIYGDEHSLDVMKFGSRYFSYVASTGIFTKASYTTPQSIKNVLGHLAYILEGIKELGNIKPTHLKVKISGEVYEDDYIFSAFSNTTSIAGIMTLDKAIVGLNDGLFEVMLIKNPKNIIELNSIIVALQSKKYTDCPLITFTKGSSATVHSPRTEWSLDGEHVSVKKGVKIKNINNALKIIL